ncbi:MAG: hypothetical protein GY868_10290, partial [Deltaproteobacteria bacterium]|nr:hypothetical protein [Deltaproteobacteria bacterium]
RLIAGLHKINALFNKKRSALSEKIDLQQARRLIDKDVPQRYASRYLHLSRARKSLDRDRYSQRRVEYITVNQILNIVQENLKQAISQSNSAQAPRPQQFPQQTRNPVVRTAQSRTSHPLSGHRRAAALPQSQTLEVEIDPIQSVFLGNQYAFMFRRILFNNQVYRQGAVIKLKDFLAHLVKKTFENQPMARF